MNVRVAGRAQPPPGEFLCGKLLQVVTDDVFAFHTVQPLFSLLSQSKQLPPLERCWGGSGELVCDLKQWGFSDPAPALLRETRYREVHAINE